MNQNADQFSEGGTGGNGDRVKIAKPPAGAHILSEFKDVEPGGAVNGIPRAGFVNPADKKNLLYGFLALIVFLIIFFALEYKQWNEAAAEKALKQSAASSSSMEKKEGQ